MIDDRKILNTLEANDLLQDVHKHLDDPKLSSWKELSDFVMMAVEYIPDLINYFLVFNRSKADMSPLPYLLWHKEEDETVDEMLSTAFDEFISRHGKEPNFIMIHPITLASDDMISYRGVGIKLSNAVLPGHVWMGIR